MGQASGSPSSRTCPSSSFSFELSLSKARKAGGGNRGSLGRVSVVSGTSPRGYRGHKLQVVPFFLSVGGSQAEDPVPLWGAPFVFSLCPRTGTSGDRGIGREEGAQSPFLPVPALTLMMGLQPPAGTVLPSLCLPKACPWALHQPSLHFCSCSHALLPGQGGVQGVGATPPTHRLAEAGVLWGLYSGEGPASPSQLSKNDWFPEGLWEGKSAFGFCGREAGRRLLPRPLPLSSCESAGDRQAAQPPCPRACPLAHSWEWGASWK